MLSMTKDMVAGQPKLKYIFPMMLILQTQVVITLMLLAAHIIGTRMVMDYKILVIIIPILLARAKRILPYFH